MRTRNRKSKLLIEPPASATGDIAFNLIIFFLVCASVQPNRGRPQELPRSEEKKDKKQQSENIEVTLTRVTAAINGDVVRPEDFRVRLRQLLKPKTRPEDKVVILKSEPDTPWHRYILITGWIKDEGGVVTLLIEEEQTVVVP